MGVEDRVSISICRFEELINIETRVQILVEKLDQKEYVSDEEIYLVLGCVNKYKVLKQENEKKREKILGKVTGKCQESELATRNTEVEKVSVAQT
jgi:hypothetical protein